MYIYIDIHPYIYIYKYRIFSVLFCEISLPDIYHRQLGSCTIVGPIESICINNMLRIRLAKLSFQKKCSVIAAFKEIPKSNMQQYSD